MHRCYPLISVTNAANEHVWHRRYTNDVPFCLTVWVHKEMMRGFHKYFYNKCALTCSNVWHLWHSCRARHVSSCEAIIYGNIKTTLSSRCEGITKASAEWRKAWNIIWWRIIIGLVRQRSSSFHGVLSCFLLCPLFSMHFYFTTQSVCLKICLLIHWLHTVQLTEGE